MLSIPRSTLRSFQRVIYKAGLFKRSKASPPGCLCLVADSTGLKLIGCDAQISVSLQIPGSHEAEILTLPLNCLTDWCHRTEGDIQLVVRSDRVFASWTDRDVPSEREYEQLTMEQISTEPASPEHWSKNSPEFLSAIRNAMQVTDTESTRYALNCVQLTGIAGEITATDSRQALIQKGFEFPWADTVMIPASKVFESAEIPTDVPVKIGRTDSHVQFHIGSWVIAIAIRTEGRFPNVHRIVPNATAVTTRLQVDPTDARFLVERLEQLPVADDFHQSVTIDLNGSVAIRSRQSSDPVPTELVLGRSRKEGDEIRVALDRRYLKRAIGLGFTEFGFTSKEGPVHCHDVRRDYVCLALVANAAVLPDENARVVDSRFVAVSKPNDTSVVVPSAAPTIDRRRLRRSRLKSRPIPQRDTINSSSIKEPVTTKNESTTPSESELIEQLVDLTMQRSTIEQSIVTIGRHLRSRRTTQKPMNAPPASLQSLEA